MGRFWTLAVVAAMAGLATGCTTATPAASGGGQSRAPVAEVLPNGLTVVVQVHRAADIVAVHLRVATGVRYESPETLGHAHFQEHMLFKGTDTFGPGYIDRTVEGAGAPTRSRPSTTRLTRCSCRARRRPPPFVNYNLGKGWYLTSEPVMTVNWEADRGERWTVPVGGGVGRLFKVGSPRSTPRFRPTTTRSSPGSAGAAKRIRPIAG